MSTLYNPEIDPPAAGLTHAADVLTALDELLQQAGARRPAGRKTVTLSPAALQGLRALVSTSRDVVETIADVIDRDPCSRTFYDILTYCKRYPRTVEDVARVLDVADETRFTNWPAVRRLILETHAAQQESRRQRAQQLQERQTGEHPSARDGDTDEELSEA